MIQHRPRAGKAAIVTLALILGLGVFLRLPPELFGPDGCLHAIASLHPQPAFTTRGFDEDLYRTYVDGLSKGGLSAYPEIVDEYIAHQKTLTGSILPPVRFLYIFTAYLWRSLFGGDSMSALQNVAAFFTILTFGLVALFCWRIGGPICSLGVSALFAFAPTQIHMSQHALVDGFFTFWATLTLWLLWENLRRPNEPLRVTAYVVSLALLALTKENAAFAWFGCVALILANRWLQFGTVTRELLVATVLGPLLGVIVLVFLAGGVSTLYETYHLSITKNFTLGYAIATGDGPWHRYLVDLLLVSPIVFLLAVGSLFRLDRTQKPEWFMTIFIAASYLVMCNVKYGMNLRYANMWDFPLRFLAFGQLTRFANILGRWRTLALCAAVLAVSLAELHQYIELAVRYPLYELITAHLLRALKILKLSPDPLP